MSMRYPGGFIASTPVTAAYPSGVWTQAQAIPYQAQNVWTRDQYWPYTTLLLQGNGTNGAQNNTFLDSSSNNFTITRNGNTTQGSFTPYEQDGYWSNYFDGSGDFLTAPSNAAFDFGTSNFTIETWGYRTSSGSWGSLISRRSAGANYGPFFLGVDPSNVPYFLCSSSGSSWLFVIAGSALPLNTWFHLAGVRNGNTFTLYVNGVSVGTASSSASLMASSVAACIGAHADGSEPFAGYISNAHIVKGTAVYTANFTPSTTPLTATTNTSLLTCQSNRFIDNSTNAFAITRNGDASVQAFQPFPGATTYSGTVLGGSAYFDGNGDSLSIPDNAALDFGTGDFTIEFWFNLTQSQDSTAASGWPTSGSVVGGWGVDTSNTGVGFTTAVNDVYISATRSGTVPNNTWNHFAVVRSGSTVTVYLNGIGGTPVTNTQSVNTQSSGMMIGRSIYDPNPRPYQGYIANFRIVKGTAVYTANFTPPTAPLTAITNTSLLLNFTNAGISDAAVMNDLETVGNAQVSTSVVKYGTGSMAFDGTSNCRVQVSSNVAPVSLNMGTGDYTVELWMYAGTPGSQQTIFDFRNADVSGQGVALSYSPSRTLFVYMLANRITSSPIAANTWTHVAVVRANGIYTLYVNGLSAGTWANSDAVVPPANRPYIGAVNDGSQVFNGYIDDLRITKAARYLTSFTPPPARFPGQ